MTHPIQHISNTILLVMMDVEEGHEAEFDRSWRSRSVISQTSRSFTGLRSWLQVCP